MTLAVEWDVKPQLRTKFKDSLTKVLILIAKLVFGYIDKAKSTAFSCGLARYAKID